ncbi:MAG: hypothetical protein KDB37_20325, partial [Ilumatobacter sp.]|nr:hypothetical protein [Ilumatobacter sp.]
MSVSVSDTVTPSVVLSVAVGLVLEVPSVADSLPPGPIDVPSVADSLPPGPMVVPFVALVPDVSLVDSPESEVFSLSPHAVSASVQLASSAEARERDRQAIAVLQSKKMNVWTG